MGGAVLLTGLVVWARSWEPPQESYMSAMGQEAVDLAVACIGAGEMRPAIAELTDRELDSMVTILARLISAYGSGDFDSFLALRSSDLEFAGRAQRGHLEELRSVCVELGLDPERLPGDWIGLLRSYWAAYYAEAPVARFLPEASVLELHEEGLGERTTSAWDAEFDAACAELPGFRLQHRLVVPHRRSIEDVAADPGILCWFDLRLGFEAHDGGTGRLIARFVWDGALQEWFLHRATTVLDGEVRDDRRHLVL